MAATAKLKQGPRFSLSLLVQGERKFVSFADMYVWWEQVEEEQQPLGGARHAPFKSARIS
jgi:hypothetical protein